MQFSHKTPWPTKCLPKAGTRLGLAAIAALGLAAIAALGLAHAASAASSSYSDAVFNTSSTAQVFTFTFFQPITPLPAGSTVTNTLTGTIRNTTGGAVTIAPSGQPFVADTFINLTDAGFGVGTSQTSGPGAGPFDYGPAGGFFTSGTYAAPINSIGITVSFLLSGLSIASLNGTVTADAPVPTPEPSSVAAFGFTALGAACLMFKARRRKGLPTA